MLYGAYKYGQTVTRVLQAREERAIGKQLTALDRLQQRLHAMHDLADRQHAGSACAALQGMQDAQQLL